VEPDEPEKSRLREQAAQEQQAGELEARAGGTKKVTQEGDDTSGKIGITEATPPCNTGVEHFKERACRVGVDHITFAGKSGLKGVFDVIKDSSISVDPSLWDGAQARHGYEEAIQDPDLRWVLYYGRQNEEQAFCLQLHGKGCGELGTEGTLAFAESVMGLLGIHCTRIDFCIDIFGGKGSKLIDQAEAAVECGYCFRGNHQIGLKKRIRPMELRKVLGDTLNLGSRSSQVFGRWYDKGLESSTAPLGEVVRLEVEFKKERANRGLLGVLGASSPLSFITQHTLGAFEFAAFGSRLPWFASLMDMVGESAVAILPGETVVRTYEKWLAFQRGPNSHVKRYAAIAAEVNRRTGREVSAGWVLDQLLQSIPCQGRKVRDEVTMAAASAIVENLISCPG
jgi:hypothetical protein